ncbi:DUF411 domain-containing protein [Lichenicoccus sp.]|uniref:DUF411 domain-containing protein n=1 Tax=Lichenicoccus sp. TaxID=2781899 RepID=UPI003D0CB1EE
MVLLTTTASAPAVDLAEISRKAGVSTAMQGCHTARRRLCRGRHIPVNIVRTLLSEKPAIAGITVPCMPSGTPGMGDSKDGTLGDYAVTRDGTSPYVYATF